VPQRQHDGLRRPGGQIVAAEDREHARRVRERRDGGEELGLDVLAGDEHVDRLRPGGEPGLDQVFALADEEAGLRPLVAALEPADQLQACIRRRGDHGRSLGSDPEGV
jgi:hypothetical protein